MKVPIRVRIGKTRDGRCEYPDFNALAPDVRGNKDWALFIDEHGGWLYDRTAGHDDDDPDNDSPEGTWLGVLIVPRPFARAALKAFPRRVRRLTEAETAAFYENRVTAAEPAIREDAEIIQLLVNKQTLGIALTADDQKRLDPDEPRFRGRVRNRLKSWTGYKARHKLTGLDDE